MGLKIILSVAQSTTDQIRGLGSIFIYIYLTSDVALTILSYQHHLGFFQKRREEKKMAKKVLLLCGDYAEDYEVLLIIFFLMRYFVAFLNFVVNTSML